MKNKTHIVIIGGGVIGLSIAYQLAKNGINDIVILEENHILFGASGRNGGGVRAQWSTEDHIIVAKESIHEFKKMTSELGINIWFRQDGYLFLTDKEEQIKMMKKNIALQNSMGVKSRVVTIEEAKRIAPEVDVSRFIGGTFHQEDGVLYPFAVVWGLYNAVRKMRVEYYDFTLAKKIIIEGGKVKSVITSRGEIKCDIVINAAGAYSNKIIEMVGLKAPNYPTNHEILVTEPLKPFLDPMIACLDTGLYFSQTMRGEVVGGITTPEVRTYELFTTLEFLKKMAYELVRTVPRLRSVKVLRQWSGLYDMTPDGNPLLGFVKEVDGFFLACGFCGHGFMLAPGVARLSTELITGKKPFTNIDNWNFERFEKGIVKKEGMSLG